VVLPPKPKLPLAKLTPGATRWRDQRPCDTAGLEFTPQHSPLGPLQVTTEGKSLRRKCSNLVESGNSQRYRIIFGRTRISSWRFPQQSEKAIFPAQRNRMGREMEASRNAVSGDDPFLRSHEAMYQRPRYKSWNVCVSCRFIKGQGFNGRHYSTES
jgi:hypothetical protein